MLVNSIQKTHRTLIYIAGIPILFLVLLSFLGFWQATHPQKIESVITPNDFRWNYEDVEFTTSDNIRLVGWYVPADIETNKIVILLHGYPAEKGDLLSWASFLKKDYNLLFFDFRYFGESEGNFASLGYYEKADVLAAIDFAKSQNNEHIILMGFSFGGATALSTIPLTNDISAVITDSAFANLDLMGETYYGALGFLQTPLMSLTKFWARLIYKIEVDDISAEKAIQGSQLPIFIIHSRQDEVVKVENAKRLEVALADNPNSRILIYDRGIHGQLLDRDVYENAILEFLGDNIQ